MNSSINKAAILFSTVFSPLLVPTYGVALALATTVLSLTPLNARISVTMVVFLITCVLPLLLIGLMWKAGYLSEPGLNKRTERTVPYLITIVAYLGAAFYLWRVHAPMWLVMFLCGAALAAAVSTVVNRWWKISAHMAAMGGLLGMAVAIGVSRFAIVNMVWWIAVIALLCGAVASARLIRERHTPMQVLAGFCNGFICVFLLSFIFIR